MPETCRPLPWNHPASVGLGERPSLKRPSEALALLAVCAVGLLAFLAGCSHTYHVHPPAAPLLKYAQQGPTTSVAISDARTPESVFSHGNLRIYVEFDGSQDEMAYFAQHLTEELRARGIPVAVGSAPAASALQIRVKAFYIRNRRVSGWSPLVTFATFAADVSDGQKTERIVAYSKNSKVPVWSMNEAEGPCYNLPLHVVIGEVASKINRGFLGYTSSNEQVATLAARARSGDSDEALAAVYALGFTNNQAAAQVLAPLTKHEAETFRAAAISALGTLGAVDHLPLLMQIFRDEETSTSDRYAAIKSIADMGTPEALEFARQAQASAEGGQQGDLKEIVDLYLAGRPMVAVATVQSTQVAPTSVSEPTPVPAQAPAPVAPSTMPESPPPSATPATAVPAPAG